MTLCCEQKSLAKQIQMYSQIPSGTMETEKCSLGLLSRS
jgi:hypothetical protein